MSTWLSVPLAIDSGGNVSDLVLAHNCCLARMLPEKPTWCRNEQVCQGGQKVESAVRGPTDWILRYMSNSPGLKTNV